MTIKCGRLALVCGTAVVTAMCSSSDSSPTAPTSTTTAQQNTSQPPPATPPSAPPPTQAAPGRLELHVVPNPVPFSGQPITNSSGCAGSPNTWFYDQQLLEVGGTTVTLRNRVDVFDGRPVNDISGLNIVVPAYTRVSVPSRWCSQTAVEHSAQTTFSGTDANGKEVKVTGPVVVLMRR